MPALVKSITTVRFNETLRRMLQPRAASYIEPPAGAVARQSKRGLVAASRLTKSVRIFWPAQ